MKTFENIAKETGLTEKTETRYCAYMRARWSDDEERMCQDGYAKEWAERFKSGYEYEASDSIGRAMLQAEGRK